MSKYVRYRDLNVNKTFDVSLETNQIIKNEYYHQYKKLMTG